MVSTISKANESNQPPELEITLEEFLKLPETKPASEYIDGRIYQKPMPSVEHSIIQVRLAALINQLVITQKSAYGFTELRCAFAERIVVPDIVVLEWMNIPRLENGKVANKIKTAPDWIIEILSPDQSPSSVVKKIYFCIENGTKIGWLIDPAGERVIVFIGDSLPEIKKGEEQLPALEVVQDWQLSAAELFRWLYIDF